VSSQRPLHVEPLARLPVGIPGFDEVAGGGIPAERSTLVAGTAGSGKTILGVQYLLAGIEHFGQNGVLVTVDEAPDEVARNVSSLGWDLPALIEGGRLAIVDVSVDPEEEVAEAGAFDFSALMARIESAVRRVGAKRAVVDSLTAIIPQFHDHLAVRRELHRVTRRLRDLGVTTLMTVERTEEYGQVGRYGIEEFITDNVIILRNPLMRERRRRTIEILKFRGAAHHKGEHPFSIDARSGANVIPLAETALKLRALTQRVSIGTPEIDEMCGGGLFRDSIVLVSGATGTGKTMLVTEFLSAGVRAGERGLFFSFEESRPQILRNAASWGIDLEGPERAGTLRINSHYPERMGLEDLLIEIRHQIETFEPVRIAVDSLSVLDRVSSGASFREFVVGLTSLIKEFELVAMCTNTTGIQPVAESPAMTHISTITDAIVLLRYVEVEASVRRCLTVLKMRGSRHDKAIREYTITDQGMRLGGPMAGVAGILTGVPTYWAGQ
jgi:circadian clock protein KaiC